jgi:hypothetical protein
MSLHNHTPYPNPTSHHPSPNVSLRHVKPFCVGLNCALGAKQMRPFLQRLSQVAECFVSVYANAGTIYIYIIYIYLYTWLLCRDRVGVEQGG